MQAVIWGTGVGPFGGISAFNKFKDVYDIIGFADNDSTRAGKSLLGKPIFSSNELYEVVDNATLFVIAAPISYKDINMQLLSKGYFNQISYRLVLEDAYKNFTKGILFESDSESYSQFGEDLIVDILFKSLGILNPKYAEIGVKDPIISSNTYLFYQRQIKAIHGDFGVLVEADPEYEKHIRLKRPNDKYFAKGITSKRGFFSFYRPQGADWRRTFNESFAQSASNVFSESKEDAEINVITVEAILFDDAMFGQDIQYVSLDIEGLEEEVVKSIDFNKHPDLLVFVLERNHEAANVLEQNGFVLFAATPPNDIFVSKKILEQVLKNYQCKRIHRLMQSIINGDFNIGL